MLRHITIENFKAFGTANSGSLSPITLIYGPNSGGKSSVIQALLLLRQTLGEGDRHPLSLITRGNFIDLGSFKTLIHKHELKREFRITLGFKLNTFDKVVSRRKSFSTLPFDSKVTLRFKGAKTPGSRSRKWDSSQLSSVHYQLNDGEVLDVQLVKDYDSSRKMKRRFPHPTMVSVFKFADQKSLESFAKFFKPQLTRKLGFKGIKKESVPSKKEIAHIFSDSSILATTTMLPQNIELGANSQGFIEKYPSEYFRSGFDLLVRDFYNVINAISYLGPLRSYPERHYLMTGGLKDTVGVRGENTPQMIYGRSKKITKEINKWFEKLGIPYSLKIKQVGDELTGEIIAMSLVDQRTGVILAPSDVGFGIGQLLPIIVEGIHSRGKIICAEQPEIHLHPKLQAEIADFLIATSNLFQRPDTPQSKVRPSNQWIIETHSEALILRLQRRIREGALSAADVSVLYVEPTSTGGKILELRLDKNGEFIDEWPEGFFEESYYELFSEEL